MELESAIFNGGSQGAEADVKRAVLMLDYVMLLWVILLEGCLELPFPEPPLSLFF